MKKLSTLAVAVAVVATTLALAQRGGGFGGPMSGAMLLGQKSVQTELKVTDEQIKKIEGLSAKQREAFAGLRDLSREEARQKMTDLAKANEKEANAILQPDQQKRLKQITLQLQGARAFSDPEVAEALKFNPEQKDSIKTIQDDLQKDMGELGFGGGRGKGKGKGKGDFEESRKKIEALRKAADEKVTSLLTAEQKSKWKEMTGEPFKGEIQRGFGPGGGDRKDKGKGRGKRKQPGAQTSASPDDA